MYTDARAGNQSGMQHKKQDVLHQVQKGNGVTKPTGMGVHTGDPRATNNFQVQEENAQIEENELWQEEQISTRCFFEPPILN